MRAYVDAVCRNISSLKGRGIAADSVYFGGGTPSLMSAAQVYKILDCINGSITLVSPEITIESNPSSTDYEKLCGYKSAGVNRISFGVQSADDEQLKTLGRLHDFKTAEQAVLSAQKAGFDNISCDIMIGVKGQTADSLGSTVKSITALPVSHISAYMLKVEQGTRYYLDEQMRRLAEDDERMSGLYLSLCSQLAQAGFEHYEISNFARFGKHSRHNMKYWQREEYIGIGCSAHSFLDGRRLACQQDIDEFISTSVQKNVLIEDNIDQAFEYIMLSLRLADGLSLDRLTRLKGAEYSRQAEKRAERLEREGLARIADGRIALTDRGFLLSNSIILYLTDS